MAWTTPMTFVANTPLTAAQLNVHLRDNFLETEPAKATSLGGMFVATGLNRIAERVGGSHVVDVAEDTTSTSYVDLETVGPTLTLTTGTRALVLISCQMSIDLNGVTANMTVAVSGSTTIAASDSGSVQIDGMGAADKVARIGITNYFDELVPGVNTFTAKYKCVSGQRATFSNRSLTVLPI
jgi:hypothetical protein